MANEEQLEILLSGVEEWNRWREEGKPDRFIDLRDANLRDVDLRGADLSDADLSRVNLVIADLRRADLNCAWLHDVNFHAADLRGADLSGASLGGADLSHASLSGASLSGAGLSGANLSHASLRRANLSHAYLGRANLGDADLSGADLSDADLRRANLRRANLGRANLVAADLSQADLENSWWGYGNVSARFEGVLCLEEVEHNGPSSISSEALEWAQGKLPEAFLKGIGFKHWEILNAKLHDPKLRADEVIDITYKVADLRTNSPIQIRSIFISYSSPDTEFVEAIEKRFDDEGIRSWRDVHDMEAGPVEPQLERAINLNGVVLLVLSKHSVHSDWVEWEVEKAREHQRKLEGERGEQVHVLCPVTLDDSWKDCRWSERLRKQIEKYHLLDCSDWREPSFQKKYEEKLRKPLGIYYRNEQETE